MDFSKTTQHFHQIAPKLPSMWVVIGLVAVIAVLVWLTLRLKSWFRDDAADNDPAIDLLSEMRELREQGGLTEEEFRSIKTRLAQAAAGGGARRTMPSFAQQSLQSKPAGLAASADPNHSLQGCSDPPGQPAGQQAIDAAEDAPRVDTP